MTYEMEYMTRLFVCGSLGTAAEPPSGPVDWEKIARLAVEQSVTYIVALAIKNSDTGCPAHIRERLTASQRGAAIKNLLKTERMLSIAEDMERAGIHTVILKGIDAARNYASPECRVSGDTDMLISPEDEQAALKILREHGFETEKRLKDDLHTTCSHPELGILELHISILTESNMREFHGSEKLNSRAMSGSIMTEYNGMPYRALGHTDNMLYLTYHMLKHFIYGGISLRMLMDNVLYSKNNYERIDRERYGRELTEARYSRVVRLLFGTAVRHLGVSPGDLPIEPITDEQGTLSIMDDLESGGWQGYITKAGPSIWAWQYYRREKALKAGDPGMMDDLRRDGLFNLSIALFPGKNKMKIYYPILNKYMVLYPACWTHRLFKKGMPWLTRGGMRKVVVPDGDETKLSDEARERLELYRRLELL